MCPSTTLRTAVGPEVGVGDLVGHAEVEGEVGEVREGRVLVLVEVDGRRRARVVDAGVAQHVDGVDAEPADGDAPTPTSASMTWAPPCAWPPTSRMPTPARLASPTRMTTTSYHAASPSRPCTFARVARGVVAQDVDEQRHGEGEPADDEAGEGVGRGRAVAGPSGTSEPGEHADDDSRRRGDGGWWARPEATAAAASDDLEPAGGGWWSLGRRPGMSPAGRVDGRVPSRPEP